jgi:LacI family transcriptional regulator
MPPKARRPTLATVAASAGVSVATVSKVVNGRSDVSAETRELVRNLLREQEYVKRRGESATRSTSADATVEVAFAGYLSAYSTEILHGILDAATQIGVNIAVRLRPRGRRRSAAEDPIAWTRSLLAAGHRAVIAVVNDLTAEDLAALSRARVPLVVIDAFTLPRASVTSVGSTNFTGGLAATQHLLSLGHRRVAYLGGPAGAACNRARMHGYRAALESNGAVGLEPYVRTGETTYEAGVSGGTALLELPQRPTAIFAGSDEIAAGVIEAARRRDLRIPEHLSLVGFDDSKVALFASPPLTTVRQPLREMGRVALRNALRLAVGEQLESHHVELATELVVRQSTGPPPTATP